MGYIIIGVTLIIFGVLFLVVSQILLKRWYKKF